jgi:hypothetical protein
MRSTGVDRSVDCYSHLVHFGMGELWDQGKGSFAGTFAQTSLTAL